MKTIILTKTEKRVKITANVLTALMATAAIIFAARALYLYATHYHVFGL